MASHAASISQPRVGAGVLLVDEHERVLLTLRKAAPEAGCWSILGGKVDFLETVKDCAIREAYEESGVHVVIERLLCITDHLLPAENQHWVSPSYLARVVEGEAYNREPHKSEQVRWFGLGELPENLTMTARNAINAYRGLSPDTDRTKSAPQI
jgi:8-oxo-dGTP diphosphatase